MNYDFAAILSFDHFSRGCYGFSLGLVSGLWASGMGTSDYPALQLGNNGKAHTRLGTATFRDLRLLMANNVALVGFA